MAAEKRKLIARRSSFEKQLKRLKPPSVKPKVSHGEKLTVCLLHQHIWDWCGGRCRLGKHRMAPSTSKVAAQIDKNSFALLLSRMNTSIAARQLQGAYQYAFSSEFRAKW
ncbi:hypothetical protein OK016_05325 [Vibrio chagasii]|nr:hypothetical protein [Vibrio chagasii]